MGIVSENVRDLPTSAITRRVFGREEVNPAVRGVESAQAIAQEQALHHL